MLLEIFKLFCLGWCNESNITINDKILNFEVDPLFYFSYYHQNKNIISLYIYIYILRTVFYAMYFQIHWLIYSANVFENVYYIQNIHNILTYWQKKILIYWVNIFWVIFTQYIMDVSHPIGKLYNTTVINKKMIIIGHIYTFEGVFNNTFYI